MQGSKSQKKKLRRIGKNMAKRERWLDKQRRDSQLAKNVKSEQKVWSEFNKDCQKRQEDSDREQANQVDNYLRNLNAQ